MEPQITPAEPAPPHPPLAEIIAEPLLTRDYETRPALFYEGLRARYGPVAPVDVMGVNAWLVLGYPQVLDIMRDTRGLWSKRMDSWRARNEGRVPPDWPLLPAFELGSSVFTDGKELSRLRGAWSAGLKPFQDRTRPQARALEQAVARYADDLITLITEGGGRTGTADLVAQYARPLPLMVVNRLLGFSAARGEEPLMDMWRLLDAGPDSPQIMARLGAAVAEVCAQKQAAPGDDLPSALFAAVPDLTVDEATREMIMMVGLIGDHTGTLIGNTVAEVLVGGSGVRASLSAGLLAEAVNRAAIAAPPMANLTFRWPRADVRMGRFHIAAGDPVMLSPAAAHTDPAFTGDRPPDAIYSSRAHLAWGAGPHSCLGRDLATTITTIAVERLFDRFSALSLALPADRLPRRSSPMMRGLRELPVRYELAADPAPPAPAPAPARPAAEPEASAPSLIRRLLQAVRR
ncbi:cytochrome P450 [Actinomadura macrotermitis]|uniref:2-hydroxy-5-methyl-1-naphthoate 7-hydroxylase n=1 Tax=Actinomadura macrotermitis TaxID=2585200 RepID=A0A7K0C8G0_9ACTN|nr:cytochrome P450 [Actinomadura macrotermitis]MQY09636.1 2-hydroxy-5-methyl-1-naphthoate 7-hydroxylase [Actinomadura macrotermitis]